MALLKLHPKALFLKLRGCGLHGSHIFLGREGLAFPILLHSYNQSIILMQITLFFFLILIQAIGQLMETTFGRSGERLLDVGPAAFGKTEQKICRIHGRKTSRCCSKIWFHSYVNKLVHGQPKSPHRGNTTNVALRYSRETQTLPVGSALRPDSRGILTVWDQGSGKAGHEANPGLRLLQLSSTNLILNKSFHSEIIPNPLPWRWKKKYGWD